MAKLKLSVTLPPDLVASIDREVGRVPGGTRSAVIERWLRAAARQEAHRALERATVDYYRDLSPAARADDEEWTRFASAHVSWGDDWGASRAADSAAPPRPGCRPRQRGRR
jgi:Arc/MetJ-type ribon-helix-helix transcriptional regulator